ncbi:hypothetical protein K435DRAFT_966314 [Dendrothele bispora CBS 962.96]|uniref:DUF1746 domain-containing protein n=1 Tax=Dendrothele bispora (strain CBS 962.96) TaxID=1314807 RepID=A0A4S8M211_DENBC|nr:hypothetical protein K435DRAFT_966314 [Dendrothele bispora CBS 962.96]
MPQRYHAERKHIMQSLDALLYQLFSISYFLSPSMFALLLRLSAQIMCKNPRELFPTFPLGAFLLLLLCFNGFSLYHHITQGAVEGGAIILDFVGLAHPPSKFQLLIVDFSIFSIQALFIIISFDMHTSSMDEDNLLPVPSLPTPSPTSNSFLKTYMSKDKGPEPPNTFTPYVMDLQFAPLLRRLRSTPPTARTYPDDSLLPLPTTTTWPMPTGMSLLARSGRIQNNRAGDENRGGPDTIPGQIDRNNLD